MDSPLLLRTITAVAALALAVGMAACGEDGDGERADRAASEPAVEERSGGEASGGGSGKDDADKSRGGKRADRDGGDAKGSGAAPPGGDAGDGPVTLAGDKEEARKAADVTDGVYDALRGMERTGGDELVAGGGGEICDLMSEAAREQTIEYARRSSGRKAKWTCPKAVGLLVGRSQRLNTFGRTLRAEVVGVNAEGDRATATIRFGKGPLSSVPLVREDGEWKLAASPTGEGGE